jgi:N-acetylglucosamine-6-phosphate deacetylase
MTDALLAGGHVLLDGAWHRRDVRVRDGWVVEVAADLPAGEGPVHDVRGRRVTPGWLDLQVNGGGGVDLTEDPDGLWEVGAALVAQGVTAFLPTLVSPARDVVDRACAVLRRGPPTPYRGATPLGWHVEGPMLAPGRRGAHAAPALRPASPDLVEGWRRDTGVAMVTLAPELPRAGPVVRALVDAGVVVAAGHTDASFAEARAGVDAGVRVATHLFNGMPPVRGRAPGAVAALLADDRVRVGCIADGVHLAPGTLALAWASTGPDRLFLVTDAIAAAGTAGTTGTLAGRAVAVDGDRATLADGTLAGAVAPLDAGLRRLVVATGAPSADALCAVTATPAAVLGDPDRGHLRVGARADLVVLDDDLGVLATLVGGEVVHGAVVPDGDRP